MGGRYSRVSNYAIGQTVRAIVFFFVGFGLVLAILPRTGMFHSQQDVLVVAVIIGFILAAFAKRYT
jgi:hypothetical protein